MDSYERDVRDGLAGLRFIPRIVYRSTTGSTNALAGTLGRGLCEAWTVVVADEQTGGRGRQGRAWHSPPRLNIYTSCIVKPDIPNEHFPAVSLLTGMVVAMTVEHFTRAPVTLKWPNDVMAGGRKISGVLLELGGDPGGRPYIVVGMGINVNADEKDFPAPLAGQPCSMKMLAGHGFDRAVVLNHLYTVLHEWYSVYCAGNGFSGIKRDYMRRFDMVDRPVRIEIGGETSGGIVKDIDEYGGLVIRGDDGGLVHLKSGDVHVI